MVLQPPPPSTASPAAAQLFPPALAPRLGQAVGSPSLCPHQYLLFQAQILHIDWKEIKKLLHVPARLMMSFPFVDYFALSIQ